MKNADVIAALGGMDDTSHVFISVLGEIYPVKDIHDERAEGYEIVCLGTLDDEGIREETMTVWHLRQSLEDVPPKFPIEVWIEERQERYALSAVQQHGAVVHLIGAAEEDRDTKGGEDGHGH